MCSVTRWHRQSWSWLYFKLALSLIEHFWVFLRVVPSSSNVESTSLLGCCSSFLKSQESHGSPSFWSHHDLPGSYLGQSVMNLCWQNTRLPVLWPLDFPGVSQTASQWIFKLFAWKYCTSGMFFA